MAIKYQEHDKPIFMWKLNPDGSLSKFRISYYKAHQYSTYTYYLFKVDGGNVHSVRSTHFERVAHNRVYSFEDNVARIKKIIEESLEAKAHKAKNEYDNASKMLELLREKK